jgi:hypothetical protein
LGGQIKHRGKVAGSGPKRDDIISVIKLTEPMVARQKYLYVPVDDNHGWFTWGHQQHRHNLERCEQLSERREGIFGRVSWLSQLHVEKELSVDEWHYPWQSQLILGEPHSFWQRPNMQPIKTKTGYFQKVRIGKSFELGVFVLILEKLLK